MALWFLLSCWWYGGDVGRLGERDYRERSAAHTRLASASWLAYPALLTGGPNAESAERCGMLLDSLPGVVDIIGRQAWRAVVRVVQRGRVYLMDPADGLRSVPVPQFEDLWHDADRRGTVYRRHGLAVWC